MADASDSRSAPCAQRQNPRLPVLRDAASGGVVSAGRRKLLGALALAPIAGAAAASAAEAVDPHQGWKRALVALRSHVDAMPMSRTDEEEEAKEALYSEAWAIQGLIMTTPARTLAGLRVQLQEGVDLLTEHQSIFSDARDLRCFQAALATVDCLDRRV